MLHQDVARINKADSFFLCVAITLPHVAGSRWVQWDSNMLLSPSAPCEERELFPHFCFFFLFCTFLCLYLSHIFKLCLEVSAAKNVSGPPHRTCLGMTHYFFLGMLWNECPQINAFCHSNFSLHAVFFFLSLFFAFASFLYTHIYPFHWYLCVFYVVLLISFENTKHRSLHQQINTVTAEFSGQYLP